MTSSFAVYPPLTHKAHGFLLSRFFCFLKHRSYFICYGTYPKLSSAVFYISNVVLKAQIS